MPLYLHDCCDKSLILTRYKGALKLYNFGEPAPLVFRILHVNSLSIIASLYFLALLANILFSIRDVERLDSYTFVSYLCQRLHL